MDWTPLTAARTAVISGGIGYAGQAERAGALYQKLRAWEGSLEDKVKFLLSHWGWDGTAREKGVNLIAEINKFGFSIPLHTETVLKQLYGLRLPLRTQDPYDELGGTVIFELPHDCSHLFSTAELMGVKYGDSMVIPIGHMIKYCGSQNSQPDAWENPNGKPCGYYERYDLFSGSRGTVYFDFVGGDLFGIRGSDFTEFIANSCGQIPYIHGEDYVELTPEDCDLLEEIDELREQGIYRQGQFEHTKP